MLNSDKMTWTPKAITLFIIVFIYLIHEYVRLPSGNILVFGWILFIIIEALAISYFGFAITGRSGGALVSSRNTFSLSRLQMILWTLIVTSTILMIAIHNIVTGEKNPLNIKIPLELLQAMGISLVSLVATPPLLAIKTLSEASESAVQQAAERTNDAISDIKPVGKIFGRTTSSKASWKDMLCGDEVGSAGAIDLSKVQQLFITVIIIVIYSIQVLMSLYKANEHIDFPKIDEDFVFLLLISHASYLGFKAVNKGQGSATPAAAPAPTENPPSVNPATSSAVG